MTNIILGGGITGLATGYFLSQKNHPATVIEKNTSTGGMAGGFQHEGFTLDIGPHKLYSTIPGIMQIYKDLLGEECLEVKKKNSLYLKGHAFSFPIKPTQLLLHFPKHTAIWCGTTWLWSLAKKPFTQPPESYEDYFLSGFGRGAYNLLFKDLCKKVWGEPSLISAELARRRVPIPSITALIKNILTKKQTPEVSADIFYYPKGGVKQVCERLCEEITKKKGAIMPGTQPSKITLKNGKITEIHLKHLIGTSTIKNPTNVISTLYLQDLLSLFEPAPPEQVIRAAQALTYRSLIIVYLLVNKPKILDDQWIFFPEKKYIFNRISELKNFSNDITPPDKTVIVAEVSCSIHDPLLDLQPENIAQRVIQDLQKTGILNPTDIITTHNLTIPRMYPIYDLQYTKNLKIVLDWIHTIENLYTIGRQGLFAYTNTDHSLDMARQLANHITTKKDKQAWQETIKTFDDYRIVD